MCIPRRGNPPGSHLASLDGHVAGACTAPCGGMRDGLSSAPEAAAPFSSSRLGAPGWRPTLATDTAAEVQSSAQAPKGRRATAGGGSTPFGQPHPFAQPGDLPRLALPPLASPCLAALLLRPPHLARPCLAFLPVLHLSPNQKRNHHSHAMIRICVWHIKMDDSDHKNTRLTI